MKKKALQILSFTFLVLSLQSCVTEYVTSKPMLYKQDAKVNTFDERDLEKSKKELISSFQSQDNTSSANKLASLKKDITKHTQTIDQILNEAATYIGTPYRFGGTTRNGIDCSAFVLSVFGTAAGLNLPRVAAAQAQLGESIDKQNLQKGDLVFFSHGRRISHVGIVEEVNETGEIKFIHASTSQGVMISSLNDSYWGPKYRMAKRVLTEETNNTAANF